MNQSEIFKAAHALTRATVKTGDSYRVTFGVALKLILGDMKMALSNTTSENSFNKVIGKESVDRNLNKRTFDGFQIYEALGFGGSERMARKVAQMHKEKTGMALHMSNWVDFDEMKTGVCAQASDLFDVIKNELLTFGHAQQFIVKDGVAVGLIVDPSNGILRELNQDDYRVYVERN